MCEIVAVLHKLITGLVEIATIIHSRTLDPGRK
jgi:hypothetical protein